MKDNFAQQVKFRVREQEIATMVINGVSQENRTIKQVIMICPSCGSDITTFQEGTPLVEVYKELSSQGKLDLGICPKCGQKLVCDKTVVSEQ